MAGAETEAEDMPQTSLPQLRGALLAALQSVVPPARWPWDPNPCRSGSRPEQTPLFRAVGFQDPRGGHFRFTPGFSSEAFREVTVSSSVLTATHDEAADAQLAAFERFVRVHHFTVFRLASCLLSDPAGAEEVTEEVFVEFWHGQGRPPSTADLLIRTVDHCLDKAAPTSLFNALRRIGGPERTGWLLEDVLHFPAARTAELLERSETEFTPRLEATRFALTHWLAP
ncbi:hypothetical protein [Amycolatopsis sp. Hca4]|uniref:hypothetical protein n=1 Tax=Amycolatopsis sp. Hca4 TaxID=2742131 RepID=UPI001591677C|nr:hypothetical protein [Amycolatopsis sp. Hca4]QKV73904.1 hypothetical protein HUT10_09075 [Amycolatopsis sp. Hca4]